MTYTAEQVKELATAQGLPCKISRRKGISFVSPSSTLEALGLYREFSRYIGHDVAVARSNADRFYVTPLSDLGAKWIGSRNTLTYDRTDWAVVERDLRAAGLKVRHV